MHMKNIIKSVLALMAAVSFVACNVDNIGETFSTDTTNNASFVQTVISNTSLPASTTVFNVPVARSSAATAQTFNIKSTLPSGVCPSSVSFAAGEYETSIQLDLSKVDVGTSCKGSLTIEGQEKFTRSSINVTLQKAYTFAKYGTGTYHYNEECFFQGDDPGLEIYKAEGFDVYYITHWGNDTNFYFSIKDGAVVVDDGPTAYTHSSYGAVRINDCSAYFSDWDPAVDGTGYYDAATKTFHFLLVYYVSAGHFGYGEETFEMD